MAVTTILEFLKSFNKKVVLIAHNCEFDSNRLIRLVDNLSMLNSFEDIIFGFVDTLTLYRKKFPERKCHKLSNFGNDLLQLSTENAHNAAVDIDILEKLTAKYISWVDILNSKFTVNNVLQKIKMAANEKKLIPSYAPMKSVISVSLIKKLSQNGVAYENIIDKYFEGIDKLKLLLMGGSNPLIKKISIIDKIFEFLNILENIIQDKI